MAESMKRRCNHHDYRSRSIYMVTITKAAGIGSFSTILGGTMTGGPTTNAIPVTKLTSTGRIIAAELKRLPQQFPDCRILQYVIMPDHLHFVIFIIRAVAYPLGELVGRLTGNCTRANQGIPLFEPGFNDRIVRKEGQLNTLIQYVRDNPRRLLLRRMNPELFSRQNEIAIGGRSLHSFGNYLLLDHPVIEAVRVSSKFSAEELENRKRDWAEAIRQNGVLVSPFISPAEKTIRDLAVEGEASLIIITREQFPERYKPSGWMFDLCARGRLLLISTGAGEKQPLRRSEALEMNGLAEAIASGSFRLQG